MNRNKRKEQIRIFELPLKNGDRAICSFIGGSHHFMFRVLSTAARRMRKCEGCPSYGVNRSPRYSPASRDLQLHHLPHDALAAGLHFEQVGSGRQRREIEGDGGRPADGCDLSRDKRLA